MHRTRETHRAGQGVEVEGAPGERAILPRQGRKRSPLPVVATATSQASAAHVNGSCRCGSASAGRRKARELRCRRRLYTGQGARDDGVLQDARL